MRDIQLALPKYDTKVLDIQVARELHCETLFPDHLESLLRFLNLTEDDTKTNVSDKFNLTRVEVHGQKPNKVKVQKGQATLSVVGGQGANDK